MTIFQTIKSYDPCEPDEHVVIGRPGVVRMDLTTSPSLVKRFGKKIKTAGGTYSKCRGYADYRYVSLPLNDDTRDLINTLIREYGKTGGKDTTMVARSTGVSGAQAWMDVHYVPHGADSPLRVFEEKYFQALRNAMDRGMCNLHEGEPPVADPLVYAKRRLERAQVNVANAETALLEAQGDEHAAREEVVCLEADEKSSRRTS